MDKGLDKLIAFITEHYPFEPANFPALENVSDEEKLQFAVRHLCLHFAKTTGKLVAAVEPTDHGGEIDREASRKRWSSSLSLHCVLRNSWV